MKGRMKGLLLVDKPSGITSHDVVDKIRKAAGIRRVGHTGTLDPLATGLLIICLGPATRLSEHLTGLDKIYEGDMRFGIVTDSYDMAGTVVEEHPVPELTVESIQEKCDSYSGDILQAPPMVSAVKIRGERLYKRARKGEIVEREPRPVRVNEFTVKSYAAPLASFLVSCTSGTYVRSLCHDVGHDLGCGATLNSLRRSRVGRHSVEDARTVDQLQTPEDVLEHLMPLGEALDLPEVVVRRGRYGLVSSGTALGPGDITSDFPEEEGWVQLKSDDGELLALAQVELGSDARLNPRRVFIESR